MAQAVRRESSDAEDRLSAETAAAARNWLDLLLRTIRTCRLYRPDNPGALRFRSRLFESLREFLAAHGSLTVRVTSNGFSLDGGVSLGPPETGTETAFHLYRDGIRAITFHPGVDAAELNSLVDLLLARTTDEAAADDLQVALWKLAPEHIAWLAIPLENDLKPGDGEASQDVGWPDPTREDDPEGRAGDAGPAVPPSSALPSRSDDWITRTAGVASDSASEPPAADRTEDADRLLQAFRSERSAAIHKRARSIVQTCCAQCSAPADRHDFLEVLHRLLRHAISEGEWEEASITVDLLRTETEAGGWSEDHDRKLLAFAPVLRVAERLDESEAGDLAGFIRFATTIGDASIDWLVYAMSECQQRRNRRALADALVPLCRCRPERIRRWIGDSRWFVARNLAYILGATGERSAASLLEPLAGHPDRRVRREVASALGKIDPEVSHPILKRMLSEPDSRVLTAILDRLTGMPDPPLARQLLRRIGQPDFPQRADAERFAFCRATGSAGGDAILADLEEELAKGGWIASGRFTHSDAMALCIAGIGTPAARAVLQKHSRSLRSEVRQACRKALGEVAT